MERMYQEYKDIAEFRLVYINEAHAADGTWPVGYAKELGIKEHTSYGERCTVASKLLEDKGLTIPTVIDGIDNKVGKAYTGWPDRVFVVRKDGRVAVAAERGPWGFAPGLKKAGEWLAAYREKGVEPELPPDAVPADFGMPKASDLIGTWTLEFDIEDQKMAGEMVVSEVEGALGGEVTIEIQREPAKLHGVVLEGRELRMSLTTPENQTFDFEGTLGDGRIEGMWTGHDGEMTVACVGTRKEL